MERWTSYDSRLDNWRQIQPWHKRREWAKRPRKRSPRRQITAGKSPLDIPLGPFSTAPSKSRLRGYGTRLCGSVPGVWSGLARG